MVEVWMIHGVWAIGSVLWAEFMRDSYHLLSHLWPLLYRWHIWHHRVFRPDYIPTSQMLYRQAHWYHDVPEASVMLTLGLGLWWIAHCFAPLEQAYTGVGLVYTTGFLLSAIARGTGITGIDQLTDLTHLPGKFLTPPAVWRVNRPYHWRHHFDNQDAYFCGTFTLLDKLMGTALSLKGKTIAVTGASGTLGQALLIQLQQAGAKVVALTSKPQPVTLTINGQEQTIKTLTWSVGQEEQLVDELKKVDILILNHGVNVHAERTAAAISQSYEVNAFSSWRLMERFLSTIQSNADIARKEIWVNTSEAEVCPAFSPLYELSKRTLGDLVTLRRLDAPCVIRKLILGPFKSQLNPIGILSADWVAKQIVKQAQSDWRNIIVTINPVTFVAFPLKELQTKLYFKLFSRPVCSPKSASSSSNPED
ncbi:MAG: bifunctional sterol desaturase/short chain dehydrogenase [Microcoleaceae cyanobacterium]